MGWGRGWGWGWGWLGLRPREVPQLMPPKTPPPKGVPPPQTAAVFVRRGRGGPGPGLRGVRRHAVHRGVLRPQVRHLRQRLRAQRPLLPLPQQRQESSARRPGAPSAWGPGALLRGRHRRLREVLPREERRDGLASAQCPRCACDGYSTGGQWLCGRRRLRRQPEGLGLPGVEGGGGC